MIRVFIFFVFMPLSFSAHATYEEVEIESGIRIPPKKSYRLELQSSKKLGVRWEVTDMNNCSKDCISVSQVNSSWKMKATSQYGVGYEYNPKDEKIILEYENISDHQVVINILKYKYICDSEACDHMRNLGVKDPINFISNDTPLFKRIRVSKFINIKHSVDKSWSRISGKTESGDLFTADFIWWKFDPDQEINCFKYLDRYKKKTDSEKTSVMFSGPIMYNTQENNIPVFYRVEGCMGRPPGFPKDEKDI